MSVPANKPSGRRFDFEDRTYTKAEHAREWERRKRFAWKEWQRAIKTPPSFTYTVQVEVPKDDPRYEFAPIGEVWINMSGPPIKVKKP